MCACISRLISSLTIGGTFSSILKSMSFSIAFKSFSESGIATLDQKRDTQSSGSSIEPMVEFSCVFEGVLHVR